MHEFSIAMSIIDAVEEESRKANASSVSSLTLDIGTLAGIEFYALETALEMAVNNTILEDSEIIINKIIARAECLGCGNEFNINTVTDECPSCSGLFHIIIAGKELKIKSIVVED